MPPNLLPGLLWVETRIRELSAELVGVEGDPEIQRRLEERIREIWSNL